MNEMAENECKRRKRMNQDREIKKLKDWSEIIFYQCATCEKWIYPNNYQFANSKSGKPMYCQDNNTCSPKRRRYKN